MNRPPSRPRGGVRLAWGLAVACVAYACLQPFAKQQLGLPLPSLAAVFSNSGTPAAVASAESASAHAPGGTTAGQPAASDDRDLSEDRLYDWLRDTGSQRYESPAGLIYAPMAGPEKHRLEHLARHLKDQPDRPSPHGVFTAEMRQVLRWLDDVYKRAGARADGTRVRTEGRRTVMEAGFDSPVGFVGGQVGARQGHPDAARIRLVVEGQRVITAFPF